MVWSLGLLGWGLGLYVFGPMIAVLLSSIVDTSGDRWVLAMIAFMVGIWAAILIGAIWFGRLGYRLGKRLHETDSDRTYQTTIKNHDTDVKQIEEADVSYPDSFLVHYRKILHRLLRNLRP